MPKASDKTASESTGRQSQAPAKAPAKAAAKPVARKRVAEAEAQAPQAAATPKRPRASAKAKAAPKENSPAAKSTRNTMPGSRLVKLIKKVIVDRGLPDRAIADVMGITVIYWNSLLTGIARFGRLAKKSCRWWPTSLVFRSSKFTTWLISSRQKILSTKKILMSNSGCRLRRWAAIPPGWLYPETGRMGSNPSRRSHDHGVAV